MKKAGKIKAKAFYLRILTLRPTLKLAFILLLFLSLPLIHGASALIEFEAPPDNYPTQVLPYWVVTGNLNGDTTCNGNPCLDLVAGTGWGKVEVFMNNGLGNGKFLPKVEYPAGGGFMGDQIQGVLADVDPNNEPSHVPPPGFVENGPDLIVTGSDTTLGFSVLLNNSDGTFATPVAFATGGGGYHFESLAVADFNGDGFADVAGVEYDNNRLRIYLGDGGDGIDRGDGLGGLNFTEFASYNVGAISQPGNHFVKHADFDNDGKQDLAIANSSLGTILIFLGDGLGHFVPPQPPLSPSIPNAIRSHPNKFDIADFNNDGDLDIAAPENGSSVSIFFGDGAGGFSVGPTYSTLPNPNAIAAADFNHDGVPDLAVAIVNPVIGDPGGAAVLINNGNGTFQTPRNFVAGTYPVSIAAGDFDGYGNTDIALADIHNSKVYVLLQSVMVTDVTSLAADGSYKAGVTIPIRVKFNKNVAVTGTPQLQLETGATDQQANYVSGTGTDTLTFNYTVQAGDDAADLDYKATTSLTLNGGAIKNADNLAADANLELPAPGAAHSLGDNKNLVIDTTAPVIAITAPTHVSGANIADTTINVTDDHGLLASQVTATSSTAGYSNFICTQTDAVTVDCTIDITSSGDLTINSHDFASNLGTQTELGYTISTLAPIIVITAPTKIFNADITNTTIHVTDADGIIPADVVIDGTNTVGYNSFTCNPTDANTVDCTITITSSGNLVITATDSLSNASTLAENGYIIETTLPVIAITAPTKISNVNIVNTTIQVTDNNAIIANNVTIDVSSTATADNLVCVQTNITTIDCTIRITASGNLVIKAIDVATNEVLQAENNYVVDATPPVITITAPTKFNNTTISDTTIRVTDNNAITAANVLTTGTTATIGGSFSCLQTSVTQVDCVVDITSAVTPGKNLTIVATDDAGNVSTNIENFYIIDPAAPTAQFTTTSANGDESVTPVNLEVSLDGVSGTAIVVNYTVIGGTATNGVGADYVIPSSGTVTITAGLTTADIPITINDDAVLESNETIIVTLVSSPNAGLGLNRIFTYTIIDNEAGVTIVESGGSTNVTEGGVTDTYTVVLHALPTADVNIAIATADGQTTALPTPLVFTPLNWFTLQTVTVTAVDDSVFEPAHTGIIAHTATSLDLNYDGIAIINVIAQITENDSAGPSDTLKPPADLTCQAVDLTVGSQTIKALNWNFTDNNTMELGYRLYRATDGALIREIAIPGTTQIQEPDVAQNPITGLLEVNQPFARFVRAYNDHQVTADSLHITCYTLANTPKKIRITDIQPESITIKLDPNDGNPAETKYAIRVISGPPDQPITEFVNPDGSLSPTENWRTYAQFGGDNGLEVTGVIPPTNSNVNAALVSMALTTGQPYSFSAKAKNGDNIETAYSDSNDATPQTGTQPDITAVKGVAINLAWNNLLGLFATAWAGNSLLINVSGSFGQMVGVFSWLLNIILLILLIMFGLILYRTLKNLKHEFKYPETFKLIWSILSREAYHSYTKHAPQTDEGVYHQSAYWQHKKLHNLSQGTLLGAIGVAGLKLMILGAMVFGIIGLNHSGLAQTVYTQSGTPVKVGDVLSYIVEVTNNGTASGQNTTISDTLSGYLTYQTDSAKINKNDSDVPVTAANFTASGNDLTFKINDLGINENAYVVFKAVVTSGSEGKIIENSANVIGDNFSMVTTAKTSNEVERPVVINTNVNQPPVAPPPLNTNQPVTPPTNTNQPVTPPGITNTNQPPVPPGITNTNQPPAPPPTNTNQAPEISPFITDITAPIEIPIIGPIINEIIKVEPFKTVNEVIFDNPQVEQVSQNIVTPILITLAAVNTLPAVIILTLYLLPYLHLIFLEPLLAIFRKKRKKWGIVYNSLTKLPVDLALVRLYNKKNNQLVQTRVTDREGRYIIIAKEPGKYYLTVTKPGYSSPSSYLKGETQDTKYIDLYHGEAIDVTEKDAVITANIPLDPAEQKALAFAEVIRSYILKNVRLIISYMGLILALIVVLIVPTVFTIGALIIHILLFLAFRRFLAPTKPKSWGIVYDLNTKQPLGSAIVRILDTKFNKLLETQVTDRKGRYAFLVGQNQYQLLTEKPGYQQKEVPAVDLVNKEQIINLDIGLNKA